MLLSNWQVIYKVHSADCDSAGGNHNHIILTLLECKLVHFLATIWQNISKAYKMHTAFETAIPFSAIQEVIVAVWRAFFTDIHHSVAYNNETLGTT